MPAVPTGAEQFNRNVSRVVDGVRAGLFSDAIEGACRLIVNESKRHDRPLAWNDVTGNLRASISFQVEGRVKAPVLLSKAAAGPDAGRVYNTLDYVSGKAGDDGEYGVVYAPPEYAVHVEMKSSRSVLVEPLRTVRDALLTEMGREARAAWEHHLGVVLMLPQFVGLGPMLR